MANVIELNDFTVQRGQKIILNHASLTIQEGEFVLLSGATGAGKSTLFQILSGLEKKDYHGTLRICAQDVQGLPLTERLRLTGLMFQNPNRQFVMKTLRREIRFALENLGFSANAIEERQLEISSQLGIDNLLDRPLRTLSGGEKQRAALAVLLAMDSPVFLLDEPFASVDQRSRLELIALLGDLSRLGKTILVSDHDFTGYSGFLTRQLFLGNGLVFELPSNSLPEQKLPCLSQTEASNQPFLQLTSVKKIINNSLLWQIADFPILEGITTLTGDNGTGKSSLLRALVGLTPYQGKIILRHQEIRKYSKLYQEMTLTVQEALQQFVTLFPRDELAFSKDQWPDAPLWQEKIIAQSSLRDCMETSLMYLSGGQQKLVQLMAMLSQKVSVLLMDEPFSGLDDESCQLVTDWMVSNYENYRQNFLVVTHRWAPLKGISHHHLVLEKQTLKVYCGKGASK